MQLLLSFLRQIFDVCFRKELSVKRKIIAQNFNKVGAVDHETVKNLVLRGKPNQLSDLVTLIGMLISFEKKCEEILNLLKDGSKKYGE